MLRGNRHAHAPRAARALSCQQMHTDTGDERGVRLRCICLRDAALRGSRRCRPGFGAANARNLGLPDPLSIARTLRCLRVFAVHQIYKKKKILFIIEPARPGCRCRIQGSIPQRQRRKQWRNWRGAHAVSVPAAAAAAAAAIDRDGHRCGPKVHSPQSTAKSVGPPPAPHRGSSRNLQQGPQPRSASALTSLTATALHLCT